MPDDQSTSIVSALPRPECDHTLACTKCGAQWHGPGEPPEPVVFEAPVLGSKEGAEQLAATFNDVYGAAELDTGEGSRPDYDEVLIDKMVQLGEVVREMLAVEATILYECPFCAAPGGSHARDCVGEKARRLIGAEAKPLPPEDRERLLARYGKKEPTIRELARRAVASKQPGSAATDEATANFVVHSTLGEVDTHTCDKPVTAISVDGEYDTGRTCDKPAGHTGECDLRGPVPAGTVGIVVPVNTDGVGVYFEKKPP